MVCAAATRIATHTATLFLSLKVSHQYLVQQRQWNSNSTWCNRDNGIETRCSWKQSWKFKRPAKLCFVVFCRYAQKPPAHKDRPTQSITYVLLQVNRSQKCMLLTVQYKYIKSCSGDFYSPESDPPHKIMRYWVYYSTQLVFGFPPDRICQVEMICIGGVPVLERYFGGAGP